jgi:hypothetical protein
MSQHAVCGFQRVSMPSRSQPATYSISDLAKDDPRNPLLRGRDCWRRDAAGAAASTASASACASSCASGKRLGLSLSEIRELLDLYEATHSERPQLVKFLEVLAARRAMLAQQQEDIAVVLAEIDALERQCRKRLRQGAGAATAAPKDDSGAAN